MSSEPFISRWSKRKQAARTAEQAPETAVSKAEPRAFDATPETATPEQASGCGAPPETELSAEEIAKLPSLEDLTPDTDISMFLRKGVPEPLRNAALRRMWSLDPKVRDFVCEAREYAYDWNTPGGVPGSGPLPLTDDVARMVARIVGGDASAPALPEVETGNAANAHSKDREQPSLANAGASDTNAAAPDQNPALVTEAETPCRAADQASALAPPLSPAVAKNCEHAAATSRPRADEPAKPSSARRHGGAMPL